MKTEEMFITSPPTRWSGKAWREAISEFINFCLNGDLQRYYEGYRWNSWETEVSALAGDKAFSISLPAFHKRAGHFRKGSEANPVSRAL